MGDGTQIDKLSPYKVLSGIEDIGGSGGIGPFFIAREPGGTTWVWGANNVGQFGNGNNTNSKVPVESDALSDFEEFSVIEGGTHCIAVDNEGIVWSWGYNSDGQLGDGTKNTQNTPVLVDFPDYNANDLGKLKDFANQNDNLAALGWDLSDPETFTGVTWTVKSGEKRVSAILINDQAEDLTGSLDISGMTAPERIELPK